jgi:YD repeat-containing protein
MGVSLFGTEQPRAGNVTYIYDQLQRVIRATYDDGTVIAYTYDRVGNRFVKNVIGPVSVMTLLVPNGGDYVASGYSHTIQWVAPSQAVKFKLQYSINNKVTWSLIADNILEKIYHWQVPIQTNNKVQSFVRVTGYNASGGTVGTDNSDSAFTIEVTGVRAPNGGETLVSGNIYPIRWATNKTGTPVATAKLEYTINGVTWSVIETLTTNPGIYNWTVPTVTGVKTNCKVRITLKNSAGVVVGSDTSDNPFTIQP